MPQFSKKWSLSGKAVDKGDYFLVTVDREPRHFLSIGTNGCLMRRKIVDKYANAKPDYHYPIDVLFDVVKNSEYNEFVFVKNSIEHLTHSNGFWEFMKRRAKFVDEYHFKDHSKRRWSVVMPGDGWGVVRYVVYSVTLVGPMYDSLKGYRKIHDWAWFVHPMMCLVTTLMYGRISIKYFFKGLIGK